jgi:oligoribonuclease NrnB/cAMP/cGMP phosphodiesterase (DHH superfamily)
MTKKIAIAHHGHCFDGMCSAAVLSRFLQEYETRKVEFSYRGLEHQAGGSYVPEDVLSGDSNAVVDFRYTMSEKLTWWFDHHVSGIVNEKEREHFKADHSGKKFFDPAYRSCCRLIVDVVRDSFGIPMDDLAELVRWADIIDSAQFESAKSAVELKEPALQLMTVIEAHGNDRFLAPRIAQLAQGASINDLASDAKVQALFRPLFETHQKTCEAIREKSEFQGGVVTFDLVGSGSDRYSKFIPYLYFSQARYCVAISASRARTKVSVGSNPWSTAPRTRDIAEICAKYGGGGHPTVGAVSLKPNEIARAREIGLAITEELRDKSDK